MGWGRAGQHAHAWYLQQLSELCSNPQMTYMHRIKGATKQRDRHIIDGSARRQKPPISDWSGPRDPLGREHVFYR